MNDRIRNDAVPVASPDEATTTIVWETVDQNTVRVVFQDSNNPDLSDGIPCEVATERSATVAVILVDMHEPLELIAQMARRDGIPMHVVALPGMLVGEPGRVGVINATINRWTAFQQWFPQALPEAERYLIQAHGLRKGSAIYFRLKLLAADIQTRQPPNNFDLMVLRLEQ